MLVFQSLTLLIYLSLRIRHFFTSFSGASRSGFDNGAVQHKKVSFKHKNSGSRDFPEPLLRFFGQLLFSVLLGNKN